MWKLGTVVEKVHSMSVREAALSSRQLMAHGIMLLWTQSWRLWLCSLYWGTIGNACTFCSWTDGYFLPTKQFSRITESKRLKTDIQIIERIRLFLLTGVVQLVLPTLTSLVVRRCPRVFLEVLCWAVLVQPTDVIVSRLQTCTLMMLTDKQSRTVDERWLVRRTGHVVTRKSTTTTANVVVSDVLHVHVWTAVTYVEHPRIIQFRWWWCSMLLLLLAVTAGRRSVPFNHSARCFRW